MKHTISKLLAERGIPLSAPIALKDCKITRPYLLERVGIKDGTAFLFAVPYHTTNCDDPARNISAYAVAKDYHLFAKELFCEILPILREKFPQNRFAGFADHSPIAELDAACRAGLGVMGKNHLLLTKEHSSFVFLAEIITDALLSADGVKEKPLCKNCGKIAIVPYATANPVVKAIVPIVKFQFLKILKSSNGFLDFNSRQTNNINAIKLVIPSLVI